MEDRNKILSKNSSLLTKLQWVVNFFQSSSMKQVALFQSSIYCTCLRSGFSDIFVFALFREAAFFTKKSFIIYSGIVNYGKSGDDHLVIESVSPNQRNSKSTNHRVVVLPAGQANELTPVCDLEWLNGVLTATKHRNRVSFCLCLELFLYVYECSV